MDSIKDKVMSLFETNKNKNYSKATYVNNIYRYGKGPRKTKIK